jgi:hypothetical protein
MGSRRGRRQAFFSTHPHCCFCGGSAVATTEDHVPGRALFAGRAWPEGYVFPSCESCNRGSAEDELFMGFLVRIRVRASTPTERVERQKAIKGIHARYPTFFANFHRAPRVETRRRAAELGGFEALGVDPSDVNVVSMPDVALEAATRYGRKLARALHYMHVGRALPERGEAVAFVYSNAVNPGREIPAEIFVPLTGASVPRLVRGTKDLGEQFRYRYLLVEGGAASCFLTSFGESMTIFAVTFENSHSVSSDATDAFAASLAGDNSRYWSGLTRSPFRALT